MWNARHALISSRCSWCSQVWTGQDWVPERRSPGRETYANGICLDCAGEHFPSVRERKRLNVECFKMRAPVPVP